MSICQTELDNEKNTPYLALKAKYSVFFCLFAFPLAFSMRLVWLCLTTLVGWAFHVLGQLQNINDISLLKKVKAFVLTELNPSDLTQEQKNELDKRLDAHKNQEDTNTDAFAFLDELKSKYEL